MLRSLRTIAVGALSLLTLAACTDSLDTLRMSQTSGDEFSRNLAGEYLRFASFEADQMYDWPDSKRFAAKGLAAAKGRDVAPEKPENWNLPADLQPRIKAAGKRLAATFEIGVRGVEPAIAARAQARYDCWIEQQEENWHIDHIAACRNAFLAAQDELEATPEVQSARLSLVLFPFASSRFEEDEFKTLSLLVKRAQGLGFSHIQVTGHTDRAGSAAYNMRLSQRRADRVRAALIERGLPGALIRVQAMGENDPRVATKDGMREALNRRVEILLTKPDTGNIQDDAQVAALP